MVVFKKIFIIIVYFVILKKTESWNLSDIGVEDYKLTHVSIFNNHAFLSIKLEEDISNKTYPTLIEGTWPESARKPRAFPSIIFFKKGNCDYLQNVVSSDVDPLGRLWILDEGNFEYKCPGKVIVYNLYTNKILRTFVLNSFKYIPTAILVDSFSFPFNQKAYIGLKNYEMLYICEMRTSKCNPSPLKYLYNIENQKNHLSCTEILAIDKIHGWLYITSKQSLGLFKVDLTKKWYADIHLQYIGDKLGYSQALVMSSYYGLCYDITRDLAIVCWNMQLPIRAEEHIVLEQSTRLSNLQQLFADTTGDIWGLVNNENLSKSWEKAIKKSDIKNNDARCIKITNFLFLFSYNRQ